MNHHPTSPSASEYFQAVQQVIQHVSNTQLPAIQAAAALLNPVLQHGGRVIVFGSGHSKSIALEVSGRAGGLVAFEALVFDELLLRGLTKTHDWLDSALERDVQNAALLLEIAAPTPQDAFIIVSNSGRNAVIVEVTQEVKRLGLPLVAITSLQHSRAVTSRHPSGLRLFEIADVVLDNSAPVGDALLPIPGTPDRTCAVSTVTGALLIQALHAELVRGYLERSAVPPVLRSANLDQSDEHNAHLRSGR